MRISDWSSDVCSSDLLRLGEEAPDFTARSTRGVVSLSDYRGRWLALFSHPADFTPVCTSEFVAIARASDRFSAMGCELMAVSVDSLFSHQIGRASCRERVCQFVLFSVVAVSLKKKKMYNIF